MQISSTHFVVFSGIFFFAETRISHIPNAQMTMSIGGAGRQEAIARIPQHSSDSFYTGYVETSEWLISECTKPDSHTHDKPEDTAFLNQ